ncbi:PA0069 family radical SAM protein [bacterium]|nr:PA0069 family radical SAM protein [bacterium]
MNAPNSKIFFGKKLKGRGTATNPPNRFLSTITVPEELEPTPEDDNPTLKTDLLPDDTHSILSRNDSPDIPFEYSINPYRGCEHGCVYCYARPYHEYLGFSSGLDFETKIMVKHDAPQLLEKELQKKSWVPQVVAMSGVTDPYQPVERKLEVTRNCLKVLARHKNPVVFITKNHLVTRDIDILSDMAKDNLVKVNLSITSLDVHTQRVMEPRASTPEQRLNAIEKLSQAGIPVGVMTAPVIPAINDFEIPQILKEASMRGAKWAGYVLVRLAYKLKELFENWLETFFPDRKEKVIHRLQEMRGGKLYDPKFGSRMRGEGVLAQEIENLFKMGCKTAGLNREMIPLRTDLFVRDADQMSLF